MKKFICIFILFGAVLTAGAQSLEVRARAGVNIQNSNLDGMDYSFLPHLGLSAGVRISTFGIYGELLYSSHEDINGSSTLDYIIPSLQFRFYTYRFVYAEAGISYLMATEDIGGFRENVDKEPGFYIGLGATFKKFEIGLRTASQPVTNMQITASYRF